MYLISWSGFKKRWKKISNFKIQIPTDVVRDPTITSLDFVLLANFIYLYNRNSKKSLAIQVNLNEQKFYLGINDNRTLKKSLDNLYKQGYLQSNITTIPRGNLTEITLTDKAINITNNFVQLDYNILHYNMVSLIGHHGIRLMYYYVSYINKKKKQLQCYTSMVTIQEQLGLTKPTIIKTNELLIKHNLIKKQTFAIENNLHCKLEQEVYQFNKYNNHYSVNEKQISKLTKKKQKI